MRVLIMTKLFPNRAQPGWAPFNRQQFAALSRLPGVQIVDVLATIPWFPGVGLLKGRSLAAGLLDVPATDTIAGLPVRHPRTLYLPRIGHAVAGTLHAASLLPRCLRYRGQVDVLLAAWAYPDGCAAVSLGRALNVPVVVKLHGSDINVLADRWGPGRALRRTLPGAARVVAVSAALAARAVALGVPGERVDVVRNGVDGALFAPGDQAAARAGLGLRAEGPLLTCISRMEREKGVLDLIEAFALVLQREPRAQLALVGGGGALAALKARAAAPDLAGAVLLPGAVPLEQVPRWMTAADVVVMPSWAEGLPNTILEAHACGRPVVATAVGGVPEVIDDPALGQLVPPRSPPALAEAILEALRRPAEPARIAGARARTWEESAAALARSLHGALARA
jgi:glycosyltransferase involved in cell wall biosynthesis